MTAELKKKPEETNSEYIRRVCLAREELGMTWQAIADIINAECGLSHSESKYRKDFARERAAYYTGVADSAEAEETVVPEEGDIKEQLLRERYMTAAEKAPYYRELRQDSRFERFYKVVAEQIKQLPPPEFYPLSNNEYDYHEEEHEFLVTLADLHMGAKFEAVNNSYSMDIAEQRIELLLERLGKFIQRHGIAKLKVLSLGDMVQGILRISDLRLNEVAVVDAFVRAMRLLAWFLNELTKFCYVEFLQVCYSNHDQLRPLGSKASELAGEDMGKILLAYLEDTLVNNERISIYGETDKDYLEFKIFDFDCIALHGHQVNNVNTISKDLANRHRKFFDYVFLGHSHSAKELITGEGRHHNASVLVSSSIVGSCGYADKLMVGSKASSKVFEFDRVYGHVGSYNIILN